MERRAKIILFVGGLLSFVLSGFKNDLSKDTLIRPPGALSEPEFLAACLRCGKCAQRCPRRATEIGRGELGLAIGTPYIVPRKVPCDLCLECASVCSSGALRKVEKPQVKMGIAKIDKESCLAWKGDECKLCYTSCPFYPQAIELEEHKRPMVDRTICVGCGICEYVCILDPPAISIKAGRC